MIQSKVKLIAVLGVLTFFMSCSDDTMSEVEPMPVAPPFQELYDQGIDRYLGVFTPAVSESLGGGVTLTPSKVLKDQFALRAMSLTCLQEMVVAMSY